MAGLPGAALLQGAAEADPSLAIVLAAIAAATLVSEDLTCVAVGVLAASGQVALVPATLACVAGIWAGDMLLFLA
ncbi:MAG: hypothetical protein AB1689_28890, partial [Thermodesulfobacteriota bacterium]